MLSNLELKTIHKLSTNNKGSISRSKKCGCFYCIEIFKPEDVKEYISTTAICSCGVDSVLASVDVKITKTMLKQMHKKYFNRLKK